MFQTFLYKICRAALLTGCLFLASCENNEGDVNDLHTKKTGVEEAKDVVITFTTGGKTKAILTSPLMLRVQDTVPYIEFPKTLAVDFYDDSGIVESKLTALYARYKESENIIYLRDSVKVINSKGEKLTTDELYWNRNRTGWEFYTEKPVKIRTFTQIIDGIGMEASQDFKQRYIKQPTGIVTVPASKFPM
ncbi:MAG: LPS export ABC transporter periplasmic protein LptC [Rhizobacter sp.]|nr:LPS export ABC transporter periplasmic protein LptC [Ferruginibacter sp.]